jgi:broad specificity phosphatase PhoE
VEQAELRYPEAAWVSSPGTVRSPVGESWDDLGARVLPAVDAICSGRRGRASRSAGGDVLGPDKSKLAPLR